VAPLFVFANYLEQQGDQEKAAALYRQALSHINQEKVVRPDYFYRVSSFFIKHKRYEEGLDVILQGIELFPADARFRIRAGNLYRKLGLTYRAIEEYQQALNIDRRNSQARKHLTELQKALDRKI
jgi:tetratricopeptide (TPR) repeat protein